MSTVSNTSHRPDAQRRVQRGFVTAEMGLVIIMGAIMLAAAIYVFLNNRKQAAITENTNQIIGIAEQAKKLYGSRAEYGNVTVPIAVTSLVPTQLQNPIAAGGTATASNTYGGAIGFAPVTLTVANDGLAMTWNNVPRAHCEDLVLGTAAPMRRVTVGITVVKALDAPTVGIAGLNTACNATDTVAIVYAIGRS